MPNRPKTPLRAVRVADDLWSEAQRIARSRGESVSDIMRAALVRYVKRHGNDRR